ncbi:MAG: hypothetical protein KKD48_05355 [Nanoarchaeota archaeon]|nr:hypothetical protein [Nanoarchaeota archaeon]
MIKLNTLQRSALKILENILNTNVRDSVRTEHETIDKIKEIISNEDNGRKIVELYEEIKTPRDAFNKLMKYDSYAANHGVDVQNQCFDISRNIVDYDFDENLPDSARLHDFGKILIDNELLYKEKLTEKSLALYEKHLIQYGHTLLAETLGTLFGLHPAIIHAAACHHDKHPELPYPHNDTNKVIDTIIEINPEKYPGIYDKEKIRKSTDIVTVSDNIISIADTVCAMKDKNRSVYDGDHTKDEIYNTLLDRVAKGCYDKEIVMAYLKSERLDIEKIKYLFKQHNIK